LAGGAGGSYASSIIDVTPGQLIYYSVGGTITGAQSQQNGRDTWLNKSSNAAPSSSVNGVVAKGGQGGSLTTAGVGSTTGCIGTTLYRGGSGRIGGAASGGGGSGAGNAQNGVDATSSAGATGGGGDGGAGNTSGGIGEPGDPPGGGGGGAFVNNNTNRNGGNGGAGRIRLIYTKDPCSNIIPLTLNISSSYTLYATTGAWDLATTPGNEQIFSFVPSTSGNHIITLTSNSTDVKLLYKTGSCDGTAWTESIQVSTSGNTTLNLIAGTTYYFVVDDVVSTSQSSGTILVSTPSHCTPTGATNYWLSNVVTTGGQTNISNSTGASAGGYINYSSTISCSNYIGATTSITLTPSSGTNYFYCWIDWNNDLDFNDANETIFATTSFTSNHTASISIPSGTPNGNYRMRVANSWSGAITACGPSSYGEYEDYNFVVELAPACAQTPSGLTASATTATTANVSWTAASPAPGSGYQYAVTTSTTPPASGTATSNLSEAVTGLSASTTYYLHVRSYCGGSDYSNWVTSASFTTPCNAISSFPWTETFSDNSTTRSCWTVIDGNADSDFWGISSSYPFDAGGQHASLYTDYNTTNQDYIITPQINLGSSARQLKFQVRHRSDSEPENLKVKLSTTGIQIANFTTTLLTLSTSQITTTYTEYSVNLSAYSGNVYIAFAREDAPADGYYLYIDEVKILNLPTVVPSCATYISPTNNESVVPSSGSVPVSWNAVTDADSYDVYKAGVFVANTISTSYTLTGNTVGNTYSWYVVPKNVVGSAVGCSSSAISFSCISVPANDDPCGATALSISNSITYTTYSNAGATATSGPPEPGCASYSTADVWFSVTVPASGIINFDSQTGTITDGGMAIYSGTCNSLTLVECDDDDSPNGLMPYISLTGRTPGETLWIRMWDYDDGTGTFGLCVRSQAADLTSVTAGQSSICTGGTATLTANGVDGTVYWFASSCGTTGEIGTGTTIDVSPSTTTTYYARNFRYGNFSTLCSSTTITFNASPSTALITTADITDATLCGKNTVDVVANSPGAESVGSWSVVGGFDITPADASATSTTFTAASSALGGQAKKLVWSHTRETNGNFCYSRDTITVDFKQPSFTAISAVVEAGDVLWNGLTDANWSTSSNWYLYTETNSVARWIRMTTGEPSSSTKVYTLSNNAAGVCVNSSNSPALGNGETAGSIYVGEGATLNLSNGSLALTGDFNNNGTINPNIGNVRFTGTANQKIKGTGLISNFNNVIVDKESGTLTLEQPTKVAGTLTMTQGDIISDATNILTIGTSSSSPGSIIHDVNNGGKVIGPLRRYFDAAATPGDGYYFPVGNNANANTRGVTIDFNGSPGVNQFLTIEYKSGYAGGATPLSTGLPLTTNDGVLIQNLDDEGYWEMNPTNDDYESSINSAPYTVTLNMRNLTGVTDRSTVRIVKAAGSNNPATSHTTWTALTFGSTPVVGNDNSDFKVSGTTTGFSWFGAGSGNSNPLPVELLSFTGFCNDNQATINWQTASESNSSHYIVEKSTDGENWREVNNQPAAGFSTEELSYQFVDLTNGDENAYYRLAQFDIDGESKVYDPIFVSCNENKSFIKTYPNPSDASFQVVVNNAELVGKATIQLVDARGTIVSMKEINVTEGTNLFYLNENMAPGIYYLSITNGTTSSELIKHSVK
jgi:hypothetical protein